MTKHSLIKNKKLIERYELFSINYIYKIKKILINHWSD